MIYSIVKGKLKKTKPEDVMPNQLSELLSRRISLPPKGRLTMELCMGKEKYDAYIRCKHCGDCDDWIRLNKDK